MSGGKSLDVRVKSPGGFQPGDPLPVAPPYVETAKGSGKTGDPPPVASPSNTCATCLNWQPHEYRSETDDIGYCTKLPDKVAVQIDKTWSGIRDSQWHLLTHSDFGCTLYESDSS